MRLLKGRLPGELQSGAQFTSQTKQKYQERGEKDMKSIMGKNVSRAESFRRYAIGILIMGVFLVNPGLPAWVPLLALYPLATALNQWDPLNAVFDAVIRAINLHRIKRAVASLQTRNIQAIKIKA
jgi:hypothetical protein